MEGVTGKQTDRLMAPVSLHWLICEIPSYQTLQYLGIGLKHKTRTRTKIGSHRYYV